MALQKVLRKATGVIAAGVIITIAGLIFPSQLQTTTEFVSCYHKNCVKRSRLTKKKPKKPNQAHKQSAQGHAFKASQEQKERDIKNETTTENCDMAIEIPEECEYGLVNSKTKPSPTGQEQEEVRSYQEHLRGNKVTVEKDEVGVEEEEAYFQEKKENGEADEDDEPEVNGSEDERDDENPLNDFANVINAIDLANIQQAATMVRLHREGLGRSDISTIKELLGFCCDISLVPKCGSYNLAYFLTFPDGFKWVARVPGHGYNERWGELDKRKMDAEYRTMQYVRSHTSIPMPEVFHWENTCDLAGTPFALMSMVEGTPLCELWIEELSEQQRLSVLSSIAGCMSQLYSLSFDQLGMLQFDEQGKVSGVGPGISLEWGYFSCWHTTQADGPYRSLAEALWKAFNEDEDKDMHARQRANRPLLRRALKSFPEFITREHRFPLDFADFNYQNIFIDSECRITGFIDWDRLRTESAAAGCARYPSWITRDMDPIMYAYDKDAPLDGASANEESPETLIKYRKHYAAEFAKHAINFEGYDPRMTSLSHVVEAICIAVACPINRSDIMTKLIDYAFGGTAPFSKFEYVNDFVDGQRAEKDKLIEAAFVNLWRVDWEEIPNDSSSEKSVSTCGACKGSVHSDSSLQDAKNGSDSNTTGTGLTGLGKDGWDWTGDCEDENDTEIASLKQNGENAQHAQQDKRINANDDAPDGHTEKDNSDQEIEADQVGKEVEADDIHYDINAEDPIEAVEVADPVLKKEAEDATEDPGEDIKAEDHTQTIKENDSAEETKKDGPAGTAKGADSPKDNEQQEYQYSDEIELRDNNNGYEYIPDDHKQQKTLPAPFSRASRARNIRQKLKSLFYINKTNTSAPSGGRLLNKARDLLSPLKKLENDGGAVEPQPSISSGEQGYRCSKARRQSRNLAERCQAYMCQRA